MEKVKHDYKCQNCGKVATVNLQDTWTKYDISDEGEFEESDSWNGSESNLYCDDCYEKEMSSE